MHTHTHTCTFTHDKLIDIPRRAGKERERGCQVRSGGKAGNGKKQNRLDKKTALCRLVVV